MGPKSVAGEHIFLEYLSKEHIPEYLYHFSPTIQALLRVNAISSERSYLEEQCQQSDLFFYVIKDGQTEDIIGAIEIRSATFRSQLYCWLNEHWWGKGYFQEAITLAVSVYFSQTGEQTISARIDCNNSRSLRALQKVGFHSYGIVEGPRGKQFELILCKK